MQITIDETNWDQRFDRFMRKYCKIYPEVKLGDIYSWIRKGSIKVNGKKVKEEYRLKQWDKIEFDQSVLWKKNPWVLVSSKEKKIKKLEIHDIEKMIIYEDENWIVFDKPAWVVLHESNRHWNDLSMNDYLENYYKFEILNVKLKESETFKPSFGYRLDKDTSWVLIAAKNYPALQYINRIIRERRVQKKYLTIVVWNFPKHLIIDKSLEKIYDKKFDRSHMKVTNNWIEAKTECWNKKTIYHQDLWQISLLEIKIDTGRMHQIRIHLSSEWFPVLGDIVYWNPAVNRKLYKKLWISRQLLHCWKYSFEDINSSKNIEFKSEIPLDFNNIIRLN